MRNHNVQEKVNNAMLALLVVVGIYVITGFAFDFFYDLNDDMVIKDILAGAYSGRADGHTNQLLYALGWVLSGAYALLKQAPVFGLFLCGCCGICFWMMVYRMEGLFRNTKTKIVTILLMLQVFFCLMLWELVYVQYTVVCGLLAGTACFWFYTTPVECTVGEWWKKNIPALCLVLLAYNLRSEMLLLTTPFMAVAGISHWADAVKYDKDHFQGIGEQELIKYILSKDNICKYLLFIVAVAAGLGIFTGIDNLAYKENAWQQYRDFFDARTEVYDYTWYPNYEEQKEFYEANGISEMQYRLLDNYNFSLDETITTETLEKVAAYGERPKMLGSVGYRIKTTILEMGKRTFSKQDAPYNVFVLVAYGLVIGLAVLQKEYSYINKLVLLAIMRTIPWFYIIFVQRAVERITHPLYIIEFLILLAILVRELYDRPLWNEEKYYRMAAAGVLALVAVICMTGVVTKVQKEQLRREENLVKQNLWDDYAKQNPENYYYLDVYSTVQFMEKMYGEVDNRQKNYDLLGGWVARSPLQQEAREAYVTRVAAEDGQTEVMPSIADALLTENHYFVAEEDEDITFVEDYYRTKGVNIALEEVERIGEENPFIVYKLVERVEQKGKPFKKGKR